MLNNQLTYDQAFGEASSAFNESGLLSQKALDSGGQIPLNLNNPDLPKDITKYTTGTFDSPSGPFEVHYYRDADGNPFYDMDYKVKFQGPIGGR